MNFVEIIVRNTDMHITHQGLWPARDFMTSEALIEMHGFIRRALAPKRSCLPYHWLGADAEAA